MPYVLVVDDDDAGRRALRRLLERDGLRVATAANGREAISSIVAQQPDLAIVDLQMPELDGEGLLDVIRTYERLHRLPVVIFTASSDSPVLDRSGELGVRSVLIKGLATFDDIRSTIHRELARAYDDRQPLQ